MALSPKLAKRLLTPFCVGLTECGGDYTMKFEIPEGNDKIIEILKNNGAVVDSKGQVTNGMVAVVGDPTDLFPDVKVTVVKPKPKPKPEPVKESEILPVKESDPEPISAEEAVSEIKEENPKKKKRRGIFGFRKKD